MVLPVSEPGGRCWQRQGLKLLVSGQAASSTPSDPWGMVGMGNVSEALELRIVKGARLELPFGPRAKMAKSGRLASFDGEPTHLKTRSVYRGVLKQLICESCGTW